MSLHVPAHYVVHNLGARRVFFGACVSLHVPTHMLSTTSVRDVCCFGAYMSLHVPAHYVVHNVGTCRLMQAPKNTRLAPRLWTT